MDAAQLLFNTLALGSAYALAALGFVLILNSVGTVNFAQGDLVVAGGYLSVTLLSVFSTLDGQSLLYTLFAPFPGILFLPIIMGIMGVLGALLSLVIYFPLRSRPVVTVFVSTIALSIILRSSFQNLFGGAPQAGPPLLDMDHWAYFSEIPPSQMDSQSFGVILVTGLLMTALHLLLTKSHLGKRLRAAAQDPAMARAIGIPVHKMFLLSFALATALAATAGLLLSNRYFVTPDEGAVLMLKAYIAVTIGGWGHLGGAVVGALLIASFEIIFGSVTSQPLAEIALYLFVLGLLFFRPQGLFGEALGRRA